MNTIRFIYYDIETKKIISIREGATWTFTLNYNDNSDIMYNDSDGRSFLMKRITDFEDGKDEDGVTFSGAYFMMERKSVFLGFFDKITTENGLTANLARLIIYEQESGEVIEMVDFIKIF